MELEKAKTMLDLNKVLVQQLQDLNAESKKLKADHELLKDQLTQAEKKIAEKQEVIDTSLGKAET